MSDTIFPEDNVTFDDIIDNTTSEENEDDLPLLKEYAWDFELNDFILEDGKFKVVEGLEAIKIWIYKALKTERYRYLAYSWDYGQEFDSLIGKTLSKDAMQSEGKRLLEECLSTNPYILNIGTITVDNSKDVLNIQAIINTVYGEVEVNV